MKPNVFRLLVMALLMSISSIAFAGTTYYVDPTISAPGDGSGWSAAFATIRDAEILAVAGDNIFVKGGVTIPSSTTWNLFVGVNYYGGFAGTETDPSQRPRNDKDGNGIIEPWEFTNSTLFSSSNNGSAIVGATGIFDGFTITHTGAVNGSGTMTTFNSPIGQTVENCIFSGSTLTYGATATYTASNGGCLLKVLGTFKNNLVEKNTVTITTAVQTLKTYPILDVALPAPTNPVTTVAVVVSGSIFRNNKTTIIQNYATTTATGETKGMILNVQHVANPDASVTFSNCIVHNNEANYTFATKQYNLGIAGSIVAATANSSADSYINCLFANNKTNNSYGCMVVSDYSGSTPGSVVHKVYNCAFWNNKNSSTLIDFRLTTQYSGSDISNNVMDAGISGAATGATYNNNLLDLSTTNGDATKGPQFKVPTATQGCLTDGTVETSDWRINPTSYMVGKGIVTSILTDKAGKNYETTANHSVGAYEGYSSSTSISRLTGESVTACVSIGNEKIAINQATGKAVKIYSMTGALLRSFNCNAETTTVTLNKGIYFVSVSGVNQKVVVY